MRPETKWIENVAQTYLAFAAVQILLEILPSGRRRTVALGVVALLAIGFLSRAHRQQAVVEGQREYTYGASGGAVGVR